MKDITGTDCLPQVLEGIKTAKAAGFERIKINMVPLSGINDIDLDDMVAFCIENGFILNLIEAMPMGATGQAHAPKSSLQPVLADLQQKFGLTPYEGKIGGGPARYWQSGSGDSTLGLITPDRASILRQLQPRALVGHRQSSLVLGAGRQSAAARFAARRLQRCRAGSGDSPCHHDEAGKARICGKPAQNHPRDGAHRRLNTRYLIQDLIQGRLNIYAFRRPYLYFMVS